MNVNAFSNPIRRRSELAIWRRRLTVIAACGAMLGALGASAQQAYPNRPVTIVVPFGTGGFSDDMARSIGRGLSELWGSAVVIDNRPGAGGNIGGGLAAKAAPNGYTLLLANIATNGINPAIYKNQGFNAAEDFDAVILVGKTSNVFAVSNDVPVRSVKELTDLAKAKPGKLSYGTPGVGTSAHMSGEYFKSLAGAKIEHVAYKGSPQLLVDTLNGNLQYAVDNVMIWAPQVRAGRVRAIAVTGLKRSGLLPEVPTMSESGYPGFETTSWFGIAVPRRAPREIVGKLNTDIQTVINTAEFRTKMAGADIVGGSPEAFRDFMAAERSKWADLAKEINLTVD